MDFEKELNQKFEQKESLMHHLKVIQPFTTMPHMTHFPKATEAGVALAQAKDENDRSHKMKEMAEKILEKITKERQTLQLAMQKE